MGMTIRASGIMSRAYAGNVYFKDENYRKNSSNHDVVSADRKAMARVLERLKTLDFESKEDDDAKSVYETVTSYLDIYNHTVSSTNASDSSDIRRTAKNMKELMKKHDSSLEAIGIQLKSDGTVKIDKSELKKATTRQVSKVFGNSDYLSEMNRLTRKLRNQVNREIPRQQIQPVNTKSELLFTPTTRTTLRGVERTCEGANASLPCRQAFFNAGKPCYWNEVRVNSNKSELLLPETAGSNLNLYV